MRIDAKLDTSSMDLYPVRAQFRVTQAVRRVTLQIRADAQSNCPVKTGALKASIYAVTSKENEYDIAVVKSDAINPDIELFPNEVTIDNDLEGRVAVAATYGEAVHDGTSQRAPSPFLLEAVQSNVDEFSAQLDQALKVAVRG